VKIFAVLVVVAACGGEKMTPQKCEQIMVRAESCMVTGSISDGSDDLSHELCAMQEMQDALAPSLDCLHATSCEAFQACFRADNPLSQGYQLLRPRR
jgi:hypothetical protein